jgi:hypothetical protein
VLVFAGLIPVSVAGRPLIDSIILAAFQAFSPAFAETVRRGQPLA